jgi:hypothetical protein
MFEKYNDKGFEILAVNGWDEPEKTVQNFVEKEKLPYTIALMGGRVSKSKYMVSGLPTNFWIDREGNIIDREVGWRGAKHLEAKIKDYLGEQEE